MRRDAERPCSTGPATYVQNRSVAVRAPRTEQIVVVRLAVRMAVALEEVARAQLLRAVVAREVLRMPGLAQRRDHLADDRLVAGIAAALLRRGHTLAAHVGLQVAEHRVQLVALLNGLRLRRRVRLRLRLRLRVRGLRVRLGVAVRDALRRLGVLGDRLVLVRAGVDLCGRTGGDGPKKIIMLGGWGNR